MTGIVCSCGSLIYDSGNPHSYMARFIPDMLRFEYLSIIAAAGETPVQYRDNKDEIFHAMHELLRPIFRQMWQCLSCGRLYVEGADGKFHCFKPEADSVGIQVLTVETAPDSDADADAKICARLRTYWENRDKHHASRAAYAAALERGEMPPVPLGVPVSVKILGANRSEDIDITERTLTELFPHTKPSKPQSDHSVNAGKRTDFRPSTYALYKSIGRELKAQHFISDDNEISLIVFGIAHILRNKAYDELGLEAYLNGAWPCEQEVIDALREALVDNQNNYARPVLAHLLVRYGCRRPQTLASLHAFDALMFKWRSTGITAEDVFNMLLSAGAVDDVPPNAIARINTWLQYPVTALEHDDGIIVVLFGKRAVRAEIKSNSRADHHILFEELVGSARPSVQVQDVCQPPEADRVTFRHNGITHFFPVNPNGRWMDDDGVIENFDKFMAGLGREDRAYRFDTHTHGDEVGYFIVANGKRFPEVAKQLHIPIKAKREW